MTDKEINIKIAEACGWERAPEKDAYFEHEYWAQFEDGHFVTDTQEIGCKLPDYLNDLNAMYEAEKIIEQQKLGYAYELNLGRNGGNHFEWSKIHSTARQRAEAFVKTI
jgi:hypothetical protein